MSVPMFIYVVVLASCVSIASVKVALCVAFVGFVIVLIRALILRMGIKYVFTNLRILSLRGILSVSKTQVNISDIRAISERKSLLGRVLGYSSADIGTAATAGAEIHVHDVRGLDAILVQLNDLRSKSN